MRSSTALLQNLDEGAVLFCTRTEVYFGLNEVGVCIWEALPDQAASDPKSFSSLIDELGVRYPDAPREALVTDTLEFLDALRESELIVADSRSAPPAR